MMDCGKIFYNKDKHRRKRRSKSLAKANKSKNQAAASRSRSESKIPIKGKSTGSAQSSPSPFIIPEEVILDKSDSQSNSGEDENYNSESGACAESYSTTRDIDQNGNTSCSEDEDLPLDGLPLIAERISSVELLKGTGPEPAESEVDLGIDEALWNEPDPACLELEPRQPELNNAPFVLENELLLDTELLAEPIVPVDARQFLELNILGSDSSGSSSSSSRSEDGMEAGSQECVALPRNARNTEYLTCSSCSEDERIITIPRSLIGARGSSSRPVQTKSPARKASVAPLFHVRNPRILETILSWLDAADLLNCRLVSRFWRRSITNSDGFWNRMRLIKVANLRVDWVDLQSSDLVTDYYCPSFHFLRCKLADSEPYLFLNARSSIIHDLTLTKCSFSLATLQLIMTQCWNLEHFEISGLPDCIVFSESVFVNRVQTPVLTSLKTLIIKARKGKNKRPADVWHHGLEHVNLQKQFISDFVDTSTALRKLHLSGWGSQTCMDFFMSLTAAKNRAKALGQITELHFEDILHDSLNFEHFFAMAIQPLPRLRKLTLALSAHLSPEDPNFWQHRALAIMIIGEILKVNRRELVEVNLDNCPLDPSVLLNEMPKLEYLSLNGTGILFRKEEHKDTMPALKNVIGSGKEGKVIDLRPTPTQEALDGFGEDESMDLEFSFSVLCGKLLMATMLGLILYGVIWNLRNGFSTDGIGIIIFLYFVLAVISLCAASNAVPFYNHR